MAETPKSDSEANKYSELLNGKRPLADAQLMRDIKGEPQRADNAAKPVDDESPEPEIRIDARSMTSKRRNNSSTLSGPELLPPRAG